MKINKILLLLIVGVLFSTKLFSQQSSGGVPLSIKNNVSTINIPKITLASLNNETEMVRAESIKNASCSECENNYYGTGIDVSIDIKSDGQLIILDDSSKLWRVKVESATALGMQFYFNKFKMPDLATLFIYNEDSTVFLGAFTSDNNPIDTTQDIKFGTQPIKGNSIIIEYWEPKNVDFEGELQIANVIHIFNNIILEGGPFGSSLDCNINVSCPLGSGWQNEINSVVLILYHNQDDKLSAQCSGAIINNTSEDGRVLLLTAKHCADGTGLKYNYSNWTFLFNHQTTTCSSDGSDVSGYTGQSVFGSTLLAADATGSPTSDYLLLDLNTSKETMISYGACYAGWTLNTSPTAPAIGIHHPAGDVKKISKATTIDNYSTTHWRVDWTEGTTQGGSSGSPLFDNNHRIIGQVHYGVKPTGSDDCDPAKVTGYGKFSNSWSNSGAAGFAFYLDPDNTGQTSVNTYCPSSSGSTGGAGSGGLGADWSCDFNKEINEGIRVNGSIAGIPCINIPIILKPLNDAIYSGPPPVNLTIEDLCPHEETQWVITATFRDQKCNSAPDEDLCKVTGIWDLNHLKCECKYREYFIEIAEVNNNFNPIGPIVSKWFSEQLDRKNIDSGELTWTTLESVTVDQNKLNELGISLQSGKLYRIKLAANQNGWQEAVRYFRIELQDIYLNNFNLTNNPSLSVPFDPFHPFNEDDFYVSTLFGSDITLQNVTTINSVTTNSITLLATNSITILPNTTITGNFVAGIVDDPACSSNRMANPNPEDDTPSDKYPNARVVHYSSKSTDSKDIVQEQVSKNNKPEDLTLKSMEETLPLLIPNPSSSGKFTLSNGVSPSTNFNVIVYNLLGEEIFRSVIRDSKTVIDLSNQPKGVYFVKLESGNDSDENRGASPMWKLLVQKVVYQ